MTEKILEVEDLYFKYEDGTEALRGITLAIERGKKTILLGANGAGKSTLFLHFNGVYRPERGVVRFQGEPVKYNNAFLKKLRKNVGIVFQDPDTQLFSANVFQEISFGPLNLGLSQEEARQRVEQAMAETGITHLRDRPTHLLSYGEKKRVAIADILAMQPEVIIFDEPTAWLDPASHRQVVALLEDINRQGRTLVLSTHDVDLAYSWADYIIVLKEGRVVGEGTPEIIFRNDTLLETAGLAKPWLVEVYDQLLHKGWIRETEQLPRSKEELFHVLGHRKTVSFA
ncbi:MAG: ATP-binding cassette domain-containing protein [Thermoanaerobacteraceae bacterium]|nr:ATP-binding cassette domain-containing protein [Thermoanaerobacteraceae bacterium]